MIWPSVVVPTTMTLHELHGVLQVALSWEAIHLFLFDGYTVRYGSFALHCKVSDFLSDDVKVAMARVAARKPFVEGKF